MKSILKNKKGQTGIQQLPQFFQMIMLIVIILGLTFIILGKFISITESSSMLDSAAVTNETVTGFATAGDSLASSTLYLYKTTSNASATVTNATVAGEVIISAGNWTLTEGGVLYAIVGGANIGENVNISYTFTYIGNPVAHRSINETTWALYDYGVGFLGVIILVVMVYLIISIISGKRTTGRKGAR